MSPLGLSPTHSNSCSSAFSNPPVKGKAAFVAKGKENANPNNGFSALSERILNSSVKYQKGKNTEGQATAKSLKKAGKQWESGIKLTQTWRSESPSPMSPKSKRRAGEGLIGQILANYEEVELTKAEREQILENPHLFNDELHSSTAAARLNRLADRIVKKGGDIELWTSENMLWGRPSQEFRKKMLSFLGAPGSEAREEFVRFCIELGELMDRIPEQEHVHYTPENPPEGDSDIARFYQQCRVLGENGFLGVEGRRICCWSGSAAHERVKSSNQEENGISPPDDQRHLNDGGVPLISFLHDLSTALNLSARTFTAPSAYLIHNSSKVEPVDVFLSPAKKSEKAALVAGNYFWNVELPIIRTSGRGMSLHLYSPTKESWRPPVDFDDCPDLPIVRRNRYNCDVIDSENRPIKDPDELADAFEPKERLEKRGPLREIFDQSVPRPQVTTGSMKKMVDTWSKTTKTARAVRR